MLSPRFDNRESGSRKCFPGKIASMRHLAGETELSLEVQFQSELDLSRIERSIASRPDPAEGVRTKCSVTIRREVKRSRDRVDAVATESRSVEVRVIENVEELRPELELEPFVELEILEGREVQPLEARSSNLRGAATQSGSASQRNASVWRIRDGYGRASWVGRVDSHHTRLGKRRWIDELSDIVRSGGRTDSGLDDRIAIGSVGRACRARDGKRLATLERGVPDDAPPAGEHPRCGPPASDM